MKRMVHARLTWFLDSRRLLPESMMWFRAKLYALDCISDLTNDIEQYNALQYSTLAVFLDITKAYGDVRPGIVIRCLTEMGITGCAELFFHQCLRDRHTHVRLGSFLTEKRVLAKGLPHGCVLSPLLFNVVLLGVVPFPKGVSKNVRLTIFADDLCLWSSTRFNKKLKLRLLATLDHVSSCLYESGVQTSFVLKERRVTRTTARYK